MPGGCCQFVRWSVIGRMGHRLPAGCVPGIRRRNNQCKRRQIWTFRPDIQLDTDKPNISFVHCVDIVCRIALACGITEMNNSYASASHATGWMCHRHSWHTFWTNTRCHIYTLAVARTWMKKTCVLFTVLGKKRHCCMVSQVRFLCLFLHTFHHAGMALQSMKSLNRITITCNKALPHGGRLDVQA